MSWLASRLLHFAVVIWGVTTLVFVALRLTGDPAMMLLPGNPSAEDIRLAHEKLGMDQPLLTQYPSVVDQVWLRDPELHLHRLL